MRAGATDYVINDEALAYMRGRSLSGLVIARLAGHKSKRLKDQEAWMAHLERLGITRLRVHPDPLKIATEGALWGSVVAHGLLKDAVIVSDDAGQFNVGSHALCWVHAERLIHKLVGFNHRQRQACARIRARVWWFYADLKAYCRDPTPRRKRELQARFDRLFTTTTGFATLDRLLARLHATSIATPAPLPSWSRSSAARGSCRPPPMPRSTIGARGPGPDGMPQVVFNTRSQRAGVMLPAPSRMFDDGGEQ